MARGPYASKHDLAPRPERDAAEARHHRADLTNFHIARMHACMFRTLCARVYARARVDPDDDEEFREVAGVDLCLARHGGRKDEVEQPRYDDLVTILSPFYDRSV